MPILVWHEGVYATGISAVDAQHHRLIEMINTAHDRGWRQSDAAALREVIRDMVRYAANHFAVEEGYMAELGYPDAPAHRRAHREFTARARAYQDGLQPAEPRQVFHFLVEWLSAHVLEVDMALAGYLLERGVA